MLHKVLIDTNQNHLFKHIIMSRIGESELIINSDGSVFHLHIKPHELADTVILVGDPGRVDMIAE